MAIAAARITVSTTAVALNGADTDCVYGQKLTVKNTLANAADLGPAGVTAGAGFDLTAGPSLAGH